MSPNAGKVGSKDLGRIKSIQANALFKGTEPFGVGDGGGDVTVAPVNTNVVSKTDNVFTGRPATRNNEPSIRDMQRLLYA